LSFSEASGSLSHLEVVLTTELELYVVETLLSQQGKSFLRNLEDSLTLELCCAYAFLRDKAILSLVLSNLEHWSILKIWSFCHNVFCSLKTVEIFNIFFFLF
jgi:hypothetical protein